MFAKLLFKLGSPFKGPLLGLIYGQFMQSPFGRQLQRWVPLIATVAYVLGFALKAVGWATESDAILSLLYGLKLEPGITEAEATVFVGAVYGLFNKLGAMYLNALGEAPITQKPVLQTEAQHDAFVARLNRLRAGGVPFDQARRSALEGVTGKPVVRG